MMAEDSLILQTNVSQYLMRDSHANSAVSPDTPFPCFNYLLLLFHVPVLLSSLTTLHLLPICVRHLLSLKCPIILHALPQDLIETSHLKKKKAQKLCAFPVPAKIVLAEEKNLKPGVWSQYTPTNTYGNA